MSLINPWFGLLQFEQSIITPLESEGKLTDEILFTLFEDLSQSYIVDSIVFLLLNQQGELVEIIDKHPPYNPIPDFDFANNDFCHELAMQCHDILTDETQNLWGFGVLELTDNLCVVGRSVPSLQKYVVVIAKCRQTL